MVTSPYEWKFLEWDEKPQNKQKKSFPFVPFSFRVFVHVTTRTEHPHVADVWYKSVDYMQNNLKYLKKFKYNPHTSDFHSNFFDLMHFFLKHNNISTAA